MTTTSAPTCASARSTERRLPEQTSRIAITPVSVPLVDGTAPPRRGSIRVAASHARANALKMHSIMWWRFRRRRVRPGEIRRPDDYLVIVGRKHAALARIDNLVGLKGKAAHLAERTDMLVSPPSAKRVRSVLDEDNAVDRAELGDLIHLRVWPRMWDSSRIFISGVILRRRSSISRR